jgi:hypothetical protein
LIEPSTKLLPYFGINFPNNGRKIRHMVIEPGAPPDPGDASPSDGPATAVGSPRPSGRRIGRARWGIAVLLFFGVLINYFDRTNLSVTSGPMRQEFGLTPGELGQYRTEVDPKCPK